MEYPEALLKLVQKLHESGQPELAEAMLRTEDLLQLAEGLEETIVIIGRRLDEHLKGNHPPLDVQAGPRLF